MRAVSADRHEVRASVSDRVKAKLDRARDILKTQTLEDVLEAALDALLEKKDPVQKAERTRLRKVRATTAKLTLPAVVRHEVNLRDRGKCQFPGCTHTRYLDLHHIRPRSQGGAHTADNLITLCSAHHRLGHRHGTDHPYVPTLSTSSSRTHT